MRFIEFMYNGVRAGLGLREILTTRRFKDKLYSMLVKEMQFSPSVLSAKEDLLIREFNLAHWDGTISKWRIEHCHRVKKISFSLCKQCNPRILEIASRLHDIGKVGGERRHVEFGVKLVKPFLSAYFQDEALPVIEAIRLHQKPANDWELLNASQEAKVLRDADKLEKIGPSGIALQVAKLAFSGKPLKLLFSKDYDEDWLKKHLLTEEDFILKKSKKLAKERIAFEKKYLARISKIYVS